MAKGRKTGGRKAGTPNKKKKTDSQGRELLRLHSLSHLLPNPHNVGGISDLEKDLKELKPADRIDAEIRLLEYNWSRLKSVDMDATVASRNTIEDRLLSLSEDD